MCPLCFVYQTCMSDSNNGSLPTTRYSSCNNNVQHTNTGLSRDHSQTIVVLCMAFSLPILFGFFPYHIQPYCIQCKHYSQAYRQGVPPFRLKFLNNSMQQNESLSSRQSPTDFRLLATHQPSMMQVCTIINLKRFRLYVVCPLARTFFTCTPLSMSLATGLIQYGIDQLEYNAHGENIVLYYVYWYVWTCYMAQFIMKIVLTLNFGSGAINCSYF